MNKKPEPLMFINTVSTPIVDDDSQVRFDSRNIKKSKIELIEKLDEWIESGKNGISIRCKIIANRIFEGTPYKRSDKVLFIKNNEIFEQINISDIKDIVLFK